ncbi:MAG: hypothetical protein ACP5H2_05685 [Solirubrobacteraceae bacterium]
MPILTSKVPVIYPGEHSLSLRRAYDFSWMSDPGALAYTPGSLNAPRFPGIVLIMPALVIGDRRDE